MFICPDAEGNEAATGISRALGMALIGWRQSADTMSDWVVESMQEIVSELRKEQRKLLLYRCPCRQPGNTERDLQATSCSKRSGTGFHLRTLGRITTSHVVLGIAERENGGLEVTLTPNGSLLVLVHSYGFTGNVSISHRRFPLKLMLTSFTAGAGKSVIWYDILPIIHVS
jgi:hypothetical protein